MPSVPFFIVDAFTQTRYAGNPAGVVLPDSPLTEEQMRTIAAELHLETAFATPSEDAAADYLVSYYTAMSRVPLCGHDTIALATVLAQTERLATPATVRLATDVGLLSVSVDSEGKVIMDQVLPEYGETVDPEETARALGLPISDVVESGLPVQIVSTSTPFLIVPVAHRSALSALAPDMAALIAYGDSLADYVAGFYVWARDPGSPDGPIYARCFAPGIGLPEDPVTGTASGAIGAYLVQHGQITPGADGRLIFRTQQGQDMGRPGFVEVCLEAVGKTVTKVQVSGFATLVGEGRLQI